MTMFDPSMDLKKRKRLCEAFERLRKRSDEITQVMTAFEWFFVIAAVQLALHHPVFGKGSPRQISALKKSMRKLSVLIAQGDAGIQELLDYGAKLPICLNERN